MRFALDQGVPLVGLGVMLFWTAGSIAWWPGWAFVVLSAAWVMATAVVIVRSDPNLLAERTPHPRAPNGGMRS